jgi:hypothetical protein
LKEPPSYTSILRPNQPPLAATATNANDEPPAYSSLPPSYTTPQQTHLSEKHSSDDQPPEPVLHFLNHAVDTLASLSLRYFVPVADLRSLNRLTSDHLLAARKTLLIPVGLSGSSSSSSSSAPVVVSLSPVPVEGEEEEMRKNKIRRWMVATKVADYDVAVLYLEQTGYDLARATARFLEDEEWERKHPMDKKGRKGKGKAVARLPGIGRARS